MRANRKQSLKTKPLLDTPKTYAQYLAESKERNKRISAKYGALVYKSQFYKQDDYHRGAV